MAVVKFWAEYYTLSGSGKNRDSKLSNYALNLLAIFYFQQENFLPSVKELHYNTIGDDSCIIKGWECGFPNDVSQWKIPLKNFPNEKSLSELLHGFFKFWSDFDYEKYVVSPYAGFALERDRRINGGIKLRKEGRFR